MTASFLRQHGGQLGWSEVRMGSILCEQARKGRVESLEALLESGADLSAVNYDSSTALHVAAGRGHLAVVELLLAQGCRADVKDRYGRTPREEAERAGHRWPASVWEISLAPPNESCR